MFTINLEDGREALSMASINIFYNIYFMHFIKTYFKNQYVAFDKNFFVLFLLID